MGRKLSWLLVCVAVMACPRPPPPPRDGVEVLVIAPHPDDEVLLAAGVMRAAVEARQRVHVALMTNGDYSCERDGYLREAETVAALRLLGVPEENVHVLGYPDGALKKLGPEPLAPMDHRDATGQCVARTGTYADRAAGRLDEHTARTGTPAEWTAPNVVGDLEALLRRLSPRSVYLTHGLDQHPDHAMTYVYFRRALDRIAEASPLVHRGVVHHGECWPSDCVTFLTPQAPMPPLPAPLEGYAPTERVPVDAKLKLAAIQKYTSQVSPWLTSFARPEEVFWTERYVRDGVRWVAEDSRVVEGAVVKHVGAYDELTRWGDQGFVGIEIVKAKGALPDAGGTSTGTGQRTGR